MMLDLLRNAPWVSLTGLYTAHIWALHELTPKQAHTWPGRLVRLGLFPAEQAMEALYGLSLEKLLVQRHRLLDRLSQSWLMNHARERKAFIELPCGLATRARRLNKAFTDEPCVWVEADLPHVMHTRLEILGRHNPVIPVACDALAKTGVHSLESIRSATEGCTAVGVTMEGLLNYFSLDDIRRLLSGQRSLCPGQGSLTLYAEIWPDCENHPLGRFRQWPAQVLKWLTHSQAGLRGRSASEIQSWFIEAGFEPPKLYDLTGRLLAPNQDPLPVCVVAEAHCQQ